MKILFIRHGDPDYVHDSLTEKGWREASALADFMASENGPGRFADSFYCSPLGRARDTASLTLKALGRKAEILDFFREFDVRAKDPHTGKDHVAWDFFPADWTKQMDMFDFERWHQAPIYQSNPQIPVYYQKVCQGLDDLLSEHGYVREGYLYRALNPSHKLIVVFCHFGITGMLLSHLINVSPAALLHGAFVPPTGMTLLATEERQEGYASFRMHFMGACPHLSAAGEPLSGSGLFKECFTDPFERIGTMISPLEQTPEWHLDSPVRFDK
ncbi:MAG: histidine phosphatase family protein [Firmicutes bacterium]|nr:histidine phosphatase family protein [Bacillota bacterium]